MRSHVQQDVDRLKFAAMHLIKVNRRVKLHGHGVCWLSCCHFLNTYHRPDQIIPATKLYSSELTDLM